MGKGEDVAEKRDARAVSFVGIKGRDLLFLVHRDLSATELADSLGLSRRQRQTLLAERRLLAGGRTLGERDEVPQGTSVSLRLAHTPPQGLAAEGGPLVVACDPFFLVANKPAGLLVHGDGNGVRTLTDLVAETLLASGSNADPQAVQRLDVPTTGLVLFSLTDEFKPAFDALLAGGGMRKRYLAVAEGSVPETLGRIDAPLGRDRHDPHRMRVSRSGKAASTLVRPLCRRDGKTLLMVELLTGRRHQIRVHLASTGHPLVGDVLYGARRCEVGLALHAWREEFAHPVTGERVAVEAPWPARFDRLGFDADDVPSGL